MRRSHRNPNGHWCRCPWGPGNADPYVPLEQREVYGKKSMWHESSKLEWLRGRPDMQSDDMQAFLNRLEGHFPEHDQLYPWLVREHKKGRVSPQSFQPSGQYQDAYPFTYITANGQREGLDTEDLDMLKDWMKYKKQKKEGINIDQQEIGHVMPEASKWNAGGEHVHHDPNTGLDILHLRNRRDFRIEGRRMNHCIGSSSQGYHKKAENGTGLFYSVRDSDNYPLASLELNRTQDQYYKNPNTGKFTPGEVTYESGEGYKIVDPEDGTVLARGPDGSQPVEGVQTFPLHLSKMAHKPDARMMDAGDFYGHSDSRVPDEAEEAMNNFLGMHGHDHVHSSTHEDAEPEQFEPWWDETYYVNAPTTVSDFLEYHRYPETWMESQADDEYDRARADAYEHEEHPPELYMDEDRLDANEIFQDLIPYGLDNIDPEQIAELWKAMHDRGMGDAWNESAQTWLDDEYTPYLDPYGSDEQVRGVPGEMSTEHIPRTEEQGYTQYPHLPSWHYPQSTPHEEYFARNLQHHLDQQDKPYPYRPQRDLSPRLRPDGPEETPIPEQTGPYNALNPRGYGRPTVLPYGRGEPVPHTPDRYQSPEEQLFDPRDYPGVNDPFRRRIQEDNEMSDTPGGPRNPEEFFGPGAETTRQHQRAFPGMQWREPSAQPEEWNETGQTSPSQWHDVRPWDPNVPEQLPGRGQGALWPKNWYLDHRATRPDGSKVAQPTDLPPELFPPDIYSYYNPQGEPHPGQTQMWDYGMTPGRPNLPPQTQAGGIAWTTCPHCGKTYASEFNAVCPECHTPNPDRGSPRSTQQPANINTHNEEPSALTEQLQLPSGQEWRDRPFGTWRAKKASPPPQTPSPGAWTEFEQQNGPWPEPIQGVQHMNGRAAESNVNHYVQVPGMEWRRPVAYHRGEDKLYVGQPAMEHGDMMKHFGMDSPWLDQYTAHPDMLPGYIDETGQTSPGLHFYMSHPVPKEHEFHDWVESRFGVRAPQTTDDLTDDDFWSSSYHSGQEDAWAAEDEADFSATIPEPRWQI